MEQFKKNIKKFINNIKKHKKIYLAVFILVGFLIYVFKQLYNRYLNSIYFEEEKVSVIVPKNLYYDSKSLHDMFKKRRYTERLFRKIIYNLLNENIIDKNKNIIDLGAWIGDNTLPWAKMINGIVYAIDPSADNCQNIKELKKENNIDNIEIIEKAIGDKTETIYYDGNLKHTKFSTDKKSNKLESTTLDYLMNNNQLTNIGFIHLDVEGFEYKVIQGSQNLITKYKPIITTESHEGDTEIPLKEYGYNEYVIPEICGGNHTCRNSIWIPKNLVLSDNINKLLKMPLQNHVTI